MTMAKLTDGVVSLTGLTTVADRKVCKETVTYRPHGRCWDGEDVNAIVYDLMIIACYDMLTVGTVLYGGDYTAAEMAGKIGYLHQYVEGEDYKTVKIETKTFCCTYHVSDVFAQMAEWEGVMNLQPKKCHRFTVEGKELPKGAKIEPYKRCCGYKPTTISVATENARLAKKFEVIGPMYEILGSEGMKRALAVLTAAKCFDNMSYEWRSVAKEAMRRKLWNDYGTWEPLRRRDAWLSSEMEHADQKSDRYKAMKKEHDEICKKYLLPSRPIYYSSSDFRDAPEVWKQVDEKYAAELVTWFQQLLRDYPAPEWPKQGDVVQFKNHEKMQKKYQGKFLCEGVVARLSTYGNSIEWRASLRVKKYDNEYFLPGQLEPAPEDKPARVKAKRGVSKKRAKAAASNEKPQASNEVAAVSNELSLAERLRQALLKLNAA